MRVVGEAEMRAREQPSAGQIKSPEVLQVQEGSEVAPERWLLLLLRGGGGGAACRSENTPGNGCTAATTLKCLLSSDRSYMHNTEGAHASPSSRTWPIVTVVVARSSSLSRTSIDSGTRIVLSARVDLRCKRAEVRGTKVVVECECDARQAHAYSLFSLSASVREAGGSSQSTATSDISNRASPSGGPRRPTH